MKTIEKQKKHKSTAIEIDNSLEQFRGKVLFPEKLAKANEILSKSELPKIRK